MQNKRFPLFLTELSLVFLISQLFWPFHEYIHTPFVIDILQGVLMGASGLLLLVLPGWRWSYLFFADGLIGTAERVLVSVALSSVLVIFSSAYLQLGGVTMSPWMVIVVVTCWLFGGILLAFLSQYHKR